MSWSVVICRKCGAPCGGATRGQASAAWRQHFIDSHTPVETEKQMTAEKLIADLRSAGANAVIYSDKAWAAARNNSAGSGFDHWFVDSGAHRKGGLTAAEMVAWVDDWQFMVPVVGVETDTPT